MRNGFGEDQATKQCLEAYLSKIGFRSVSEHVSENQIIMILSLIVADFQNKKIDMNDLSILCEKLALVVRNIPGLRASGLHWQLTEAGDIGWYLIHHPVTARNMAKEFIAFVENMKH